MSKRNEREHRSIYCDLLHDEAFQQLSPMAKLVWFMLRVSLPSAGIGVFNHAVLATLTNCSLEELRRALTELEPKFVRSSGTTFWVVDGLQDNPSLQLTNEKHRIFVSRQWKLLPPSAVALAFRDRYADWFGGPAMPLSEVPNDTPSSSNGMGRDRVSKHDDDDDDGDDHQNHPSSSAREAVADPSVLTDVGFQLVRAVNQGMLANPAIGNAFNPIPGGHGSGVALAELLSEHHVPLPFALEHVRDRARVYQPNARHRQVNTLSYFADALIEEWERTQLKSTPRPIRGGKNGAKAKPTIAADPRSTTLEFTNTKP